MTNPRNLPIIVYLNKQYDVWMRDALQWARNRGWEEGRDYFELISEVAYWRLFHDGKRSPETPVYFVKDIITKHDF